MLTETPISSPIAPTVRRGFWRRHGWSFVLAGVLATTGATVWWTFPHAKPPVPIPSRFPMSTAAMRSPGKMRVLFLGNSLTEYNGGLALTMEQLAASAGKKPAPVFDEVTKFGATWAQLWDVTRGPEMIRQGNWDYVVLQDYSTAAFIYRSEMDVYARRFSQTIKAAGAKPVFFMTWPHDDDLQSIGKIAGAYISVARDNQGIVSPVGYAWKKVLEDQPGVILFDPRDTPKKHPTPAGTYLTACVFYSIFFNQSPRGLTGRIVEGTNVYIDLSPAVAHYLQDAAWATVKEMGALAATRPTASQALTSP